MPDNRVARGERRVGRREEKLTPVRVGTAVGHDHQTLRIDDAARLRIEVAVETTSEDGIVHRPDRPVFALLDLGFDEEDFVLDVHPERRLSAQSVPLGVASLNHAEVLGLDDPVEVQPVVVIAAREANDILDVPGGRFVEHVDANVAEVRLEVKRLIYETQPFRLGIEFGLVGRGLGLVRFLGFALGFKDRILLQNYLG